METPTHHIELTFHTPPSVILPVIAERHFKDTYKTFLFEEMHIEEPESYVDRMQKLFQLPEVQTFFCKKWPHQSNKTKWPERTVETAICETLFQTMTSVRGEIQISIAKRRNTPYYNQKESDVFDQYPTSELHMFLQATDDYLKYSKLVDLPFLMNHELSLHRTDI